MVATKVKKWGNSLGIIIPAEEIKRVKIKEGDTIDVEVVKKDRVSAFGKYKGIGGFKREEGELDRDF